MINTSSHCISEPVLALVGPTAIGKTALSLDISRKFNCEIVSVDSMQVYRSMDIGTAKATLEERRLVPHHLIDIVDPDDAYNAARFVADCLDAVTHIHGRGAVPLLTGGTGLYLAALKEGLFDSPPADRAVRDDLYLRMRKEGSEILYEQLLEHDPESAERIHPNDSSRVIRALELYLSTGVTMSEYLRKQADRSRHPEFQHFLTIGLTCDRGLLYQRINKRTVKLFEHGLETEVRNLLDRGYGPELQSMQSIGYRHMVKYINGNWDYDQCARLLARDTRHYAKRQLTWFNRDETIRWFDRNEPDRVIDCINGFLKHPQKHNTMNIRT